LSSRPSTAKKKKPKIKTNKQTNKKTGIKRIRTGITSGRERVNEDSKEGEYGLCTFYTCMNLEH
jgi:hypothetical protein